VARGLCWKWACVPRSGVLSHVLLLGHLEPNARLCDWRKNKLIMVESRRPRAAPPNSKFAVYSRVIFLISHFWVTFSLNDRFRVTQGHTASLSNEKRVVRHNVIGIRQANVCIGTSEKIVLKRSQNGHLAIKII